MVHPQRCETCELHFTDKYENDWCRSNPIPSHAFIFILRVGCASHSSQQSERNMVLDELIEKVNEKQRKSIIETAIGIKDLFRIVESIRTQGSREP